MKKNKIFIILFAFILLSVNTLSDNVTTPSNDINNGININNETDIVDINDEINDNREEGYIYLDRIIETEEEIEEEKVSKIEKIINKLDEKINPLLSFNISQSYGSWYVIKTSDLVEAKYENVRYDFKQEQNGYRIEKNYYDAATQKWNVSNERAWINEKKGKVYLGTEKKYISSYANEILFFDSSYKYMIVHFAKDNVIRVFAKIPGEITLTGEELEKFNNIINRNNNRLKDIAFNLEINNIREEKIRIRKETEEKAKITEEQLKQNSEIFFKVD